MNPGALSGAYNIGRMVAQLCKGKGPMCFMSALQSMMGGGSNDAPPAGKKRDAAGPFQGSMNPGPFQIGSMVGQLCKGKGLMCIMSAMQSMMGGGSNDAPIAGKKRQAGNLFGSGNMGGLSESINPAAFQAGQMIAKTRPSLQTLTTIMQQLMSMMSQQSA